MRRPVALLVAGALLAGATACSETADDRREAYCAQVKKDSTTLSKGVAEGGPGAFLDVLPTLEGLAEKAPSDLKDEWQTLLNALTGLQDALDATGLEPGDIQDGTLPAGPVQGGPEAGPQRGVGADHPRGRGRDPGHRAARARHLQAAADLSDEGHAAAGHPGVAVPSGEWLD